MVGQTGVGGKRRSRRSALNRVSRVKLPRIELLARNNFQIDRDSCDELVPHISVRLQKLGYDEGASDFDLDEQRGSPVARSRETGKPLEELLLRCEHGRKAASLKVVIHNRGPSPLLPNRRDKGPNQSRRNSPSSHDGALLWCASLSLGPQEHSRYLRPSSEIFHAAHRWEEQQHCQADKRVLETAERLFIQILHSFNVIESAFFRRQVAELFLDRRPTLGTRMATNRPEPTVRHFPEARIRGVCQ